MSTPVAKIVAVNILSTPTFPARKGFGLLNIIGRSARLPIGDRFRFYSSISDVAADFQSTDEEYLAAQVFFSQAPRPTQLAISRRFDTAVSGELLCSVGYDTNIANWQAITNGGFDISLDGTNKQITALNFSALTSFNAIAAAIQTKLNTALAGSTCVFDGKRFIIRSGTTGTSSSVGFTVPPTGAGSPTDIGALMGSRSADNGITTTGLAAETLTASLNAIQDINQSWYGFTTTKEVTEAQIKEAAAWAEARVKIYGFTTSASNVLDQSSVTDIAYFLKSMLYSRTFGVWDNNDPYLIVSMFARAFTVNFNEQNSTLTLKFKQMPGNSPVALTETQRQSLLAKNCNYYTYFGDSAMLAEGVMASGKFFDEQHGLDWLQNAIETNVFGYLYTRTTKVPQTDRGVAALVQQVEMACQEGVRNGLLAPGKWGGMDLGEMKSGMYLQKGYYVYAQSVNDQNPSDRAARKAPPIQAIIKGAGAIHFADITVTFER